MYGSVDVYALRLVPDLVVPKKFKVPEFEKYNGTSNPRIHLATYIAKMSALTEDDKLLIHFFHEGLTGSTLRWYVQLDRSKLHTWKDLTDAFLKQYKFNCDTGERIEANLRLGRLQEIAGEGTMKKVTNPNRKKKGEVHAVTHGSYRPFFPRGNFSPRFPNQAPMVTPKSPMIANISQTYNQPSFQTYPQYQQIPHPQNQYIPRLVNQFPRPPLQVNQNNFRPLRNLNPPLPMPLSDIYRYLQSINQILPVPIDPIQPPYPRWYDANAKCDYHAGVIGHSIDNCFKFRGVVNALIRNGWLKIEDEGTSLNVSTNPLPTHGARNSGQVNIVEFKRGEQIIKMEQLIDHFEDILELAIREGYVTPVALNVDEKSIGNQLESSYSFHKGARGQDIHSCNWFKEEIFTQSAMVSTPFPPLSNPTFASPTVSFSLHSNTSPSLKIIYMGPSNLDSHLSLPNNQIEPKIEFQSPYPEGSSAAKEGEIEYITRSGRCYGSEEVERAKKGKAKVGESTESIEEVLKEKEEGRNASTSTTEGVNQAYIVPDISPEKFEKIVGQIQASNFVTLSDDEIDPAGLKYTKALHITVKCKECRVAKVLVDNGSALNVLPSAILAKLPVEPSLMHSSNMVVRAFDGTKRELLGDIELPLQVRACTFNVIFQVMDIEPTYTMLLGRPWIHSANAVAYSLHQKIKYVANEKLVTVKGEEAMLVTKPQSIPYIETTEQALESSFQALESAGIPRHTLEASNMEAKVMLKSGYQKEKGLGIRLQGIAEPITMTKREGHFGLGYSENGLFDKKPWMKHILRDWRFDQFYDEKMVIPHIQETFLSATQVAHPLLVIQDITKEIEGSLSKLSINVLEPSQSYDLLIVPMQEGEQLNNWEEEDAPTLFLNQQLTSPFSLFSMPNVESNNSINMDIPQINFDKPLIANEDNSVDGEEECKPLREIVKQLEIDEPSLIPCGEGMNTLNLGTEEDKKELKVIDNEGMNEMVSLLKEFLDVFSWTYDDMPRVDLRIVTHKIPLALGTILVKQKLRRMHPDMLIKVRDEIKKDLNKVSLKDDFPLSHIDVLVDDAAGLGRCSCVDGASGYN
ncbi:uncharacterized protein LOC131182875 [Hevea brasiliensis]|uniref:uncharacterized protein LOC131182875 n=1 Tax=Hevea brasiliensis TaxID=3981 RepID=UPI0025F1D7AC|nr:uncharacterized protein LOC131182875 [Hevea brasiliensis]